MIYKQIKVLSDKISIYISALCKNSDINIRNRKIQHKR